MNSSLENWVIYVVIIKKLYTRQKVFNLHAIMKDVEFTIFKNNIELP